jgi:NET1-associated nuclear protein 1 (U3 small nucleolar RNA-associated protein 17)
MVSKCVKDISAKLTENTTRLGIYLLSGGREAVLVLWHLRSGHKQFLPRLDTDITKIIISPDQAYYALIQADNTIRIINALDLTLRQLIKTLNYGKYISSKCAIV